MHGEGLVVVWLTYGGYWHGLLEVIGMINGGYWHDQWRLLACSMEVIGMINGGYGYLKFNQIGEDTHADMHPRRQRGIYT